MGKQAGRAMRVLESDAHVLLSYAYAYAYADGSGAGGAGDASDGQVRAAAAPLAVPRAAGAHSRGGECARRPVHVGAPALRLAALRVPAGEDGHVHSGAHDAPARAARAPRRRGARRAARALERLGARLGRVPVDQRPARSQRPLAEPEPELELALAS